MGDYYKEKENITRNKYKSNLYLLAKDLLGYKDLTAGFHYKYICKKIDEPRQKPIRMWLIPRGFFKTTILTISRSIQLQLNNPGIRILIVSGVLANAKSMVTAIGNHYLTNKRFRIWFPQFCPQNVKSPETKWTTEEIHIPNRFNYGGVPVMEGTFEAFGPEVTITSRHYDQLILDDLVTRENSTTKEQMDKIKDFYKAIFPLKNNPATPLDVVGTRWGDYDLYGDLENDEDVEVIKIPAIQNGKSVFPERYSLEYLESLKKSKKVGTFLFNSLYMLDPISDENAIFKNAWFRYFKLSFDNKSMIREDDKKEIPVGNTFMTVDGAVTEGKNDYSAIVVTTTDSENNIYVIETWRKQVDPMTLTAKIVELYFKWNCIKCGMQKTVLEKMLMFYLKEKMKKDRFYMNLVPLKMDTRTSKEYKIKSLQPFYESQCIYHRRGLSDLEDELLRFPKAKSDDLVDALQMQQDLVMPSSGKKVVRQEEPGSLISWKKKLKVLFEPKPFHVGQDDDSVVINEAFYG